MWELLPSSRGDKKHLQKAEHVRREEESKATQFRSLVYSCLFQGQ